jgi:ethanolamine utilization protein EutN
MLVAKVIGSAVASLKLDALHSSKLLLVCPADPAGNLTGDPFLAVDLVGAGEGELVMLSQGSSARVACGNPDRSPADAAIVGIIDSLRSNGEAVFRKA